jgi:hypothetical protein
MRAHTFDLDPYGIPRTSVTIEYECENGRMTFACTRHKTVGDEIDFFDESGIALVIQHIPNWTDFLTCD